MKIAKFGPNVFSEVVSKPILTASLEITRQCEVVTRKLVNRSKLCAIQFSGVEVALQRPSFMRGHKVQAGAMGI